MSRSLPATERIHEGIALSARGVDSGCGIHRVVLGTGSGADRKTQVGVNLASERPAGTATNYVVVVLKGQSPSNVY